MLPNSPLSLRGCPGVRLAGVPALKAWGTARQAPRARGKGKAEHEAIDMREKIDNIAVVRGKDRRGYLIIFLWIGDDSNPTN